MSTHDRYQAHAYCKHPYKIRAPGDDWTRHTVFEACRNAELAARHARGVESDIVCDPPSWEALINPELYVYCDSCENTYAENGDRLWSATNMSADFETKRDQWQYVGVLNERELRLIKEHIYDARRRHEEETNRGPFNSSYWVLSGALQEYTEYWDAYVKAKVEEKRQEDYELEMAKAWDEARQSNKADEAMETSMYEPGFLQEAEASRSHEPFKRPRKQGGWQQAIVGKGKGKGKKREKR
jgi:hypothetical protein